MWKIKEVGFLEVVIEIDRMKMKKGKYWKVIS